MDDAVGYIRCAQMDAPAMTRSIAYQSERIRLVAAMRFLRLYRVFIDIGRGNSALTERRRLLNCVTWDCVNAVIVASTTRLARDPDDHVKVLNELHSLGIEFICADQEEQKRLDRMG